MPLYNLTIKHSFPGRGTRTPGWVTNTSGMIEEFKNFYENSDDFNGLPDVLNPAKYTLDLIYDHIGPALTLMEWIEAQETGWSGPGESQENPYEVSLTDSEKQYVIANLGSDASPAALRVAYTNIFAGSPSLSNTYFTLNDDDRYGGVSFTEEGNLKLYDVYNFEGWGDFGAFWDIKGDWKTQIKGVAKFLAVGIFGRAAASANIRVRSALVAAGYNPSTGEFWDGDPTSLYKDDQLAFTLWRRNQEDGIPDWPTLTYTRNLHIANSFTPEEICKYNKPLFQDAVSRGYIKLTETPAGSCGRIGDAPECFDGSNTTYAVGAAQPMPLLGLPYYPPNVMTLPYPTSITSYNYGPSSNYPSPFTSFQQYINDNLNILGPYAKLGDITGRVRLILSGEGQGFGEPAFVAQCWDEFDDGPYNVDGNGDQYLSKSDWWDTCDKVKVTMRTTLFENNPFILKLNGFGGGVEVAVKSYSGPAADDVWQPSYNISQSPFGSVTLSGLIGMAGASAAAGFLV